MSFQELVYNLVFYFAVLVGCVLVVYILFRVVRPFWMSRKFPDYMRATVRKIVWRFPRAVRSRNRDLVCVSKSWFSDKEKKRYPRLKRVYHLLNNDEEAILAVVKVPDSKLVNHLSNPNMCELFARDLGLDASQRIELDYSNPKAAGGVGIKIFTPMPTNSEVREADLGGLMF